MQLQVDMALLGHYNTQFLSAVGNVLFPFSIIVSFLTALSTGASIMIAHSIGAKSFNSARRYSEVSFFYNVAMAIPFFFVLLKWANTLMGWMGTSEDINNYATQYMRALSFSILFLGIELSIVSILQGVGKTRAIMYSALIRTVTNVFFDWVLIYGKIGFPELGIKGAAIATSISSFAGMIYLVIAYAHTRKMPYKPTLKGIFNPRWSIQKRNVGVGLPSGFEAIMWSFGQIIIIRMINELDVYAAGIYVLITRIQAVTFFVYLGIAKATMTLVGQVSGSGDKELVSKIGLMSLRYALILCVIASTFFITIPKSILSMFTNERDLIIGAAPMLTIIAITIFPVSINVVIGNAIRGLKDTRWMFYTQSFGTTFTIAFSALMLFVFHYDLKGIFYTVLLDETIRATLNFRRFLSLNKTLQRV